MSPADKAVTYEIYDYVRLRFIFLCVNEAAVIKHKKSKAMLCFFYVCCTACFIVW